MEEQHNLARFVDEFVLRGFRDQSPDYAYTWVLSSLGFAASVLLGVMAGHLLRASSVAWKKIAGLLAIGGLCLVLGWVWSGGFGWLTTWRFPIIKHIWTSSMVLWAAGWCYLLLAAFYLLVNVLKFRRCAFFFIVIGATRSRPICSPRWLTSGTSPTGLWAAWRRIFASGEAIGPRGPPSCITSPPLRSSG